MLPSTILTVLVVQSVGTRRLLNHDVMAYKRDYGGRFGWPTYSADIFPYFTYSGYFRARRDSSSRRHLTANGAVARSRNTQITQRTKSS